jgi:hypothetical protein
MAPSEHDTRVVKIDMSESNCCERLLVLVGEHDWCGNEVAFPKFIAQMYQWHTCSIVSKDPRRPWHALCTRGMGATATVGCEVIALGNAAIICLEFLIPQRFCIRHYIDLACSYGGTFCARLDKKLTQAVMRLHAVLAAEPEYWIQALWLVSG